MPREGSARASFFYGETPRTSSNLKYVIKQFYGTLSLEERIGWGSSTYSADFQAGMSKMRSDMRGWPKDRPLDFYQIVVVTTENWQSAQKRPNISQVKALINNKRFELGEPTEGEAKSAMFRRMFRHPSIGKFLLRLLWGVEGMKGGTPSSKARLLYGNQWAPVPFVIQTVVGAATLLHSVLIGEDDLGKAPKTQKYYWERVNEVLRWEASGDRNFPLLLVQLRDKLRLTNVTDYENEPDEEEVDDFADALASVNA